MKLELAEDGGPPGIEEKARSSVLPGAVGLATVGVACGLTIWIPRWLGELKWPWTTWLVSFFCLVGASFYVWHGEKKARNQDADEWLGFVIITPLFGAASLAIDVSWVRSSGQPYPSFLQAALHSGSPFRIVLTIFICPIATIIAFGGLARCLAARSNHLEETDDA